jgi:hypothetical protein
MAVYELAAAVKQRILSNDAQSAVTQGAESPGAVAAQPALQQ